MFCHKLCKAYGVQTWLLDREKDHFNSCNIFGVILCNLYIYAQGYENLSKASAETYSLSDHIKGKGHFALQRDFADNCMC